MVLSGNKPLPELIVPNVAIWCHNEVELQPHLPGASELTRHVRQSHDKWLFVLAVHMCIHICIYGICWHSAVVWLFLQASKFQIECTCPSGKWIVKLTCPNVPFTCLKYIKPVQLMWKSEIFSRLSDKSCRYSTCPTVIFTRLRRSDEWNFEPCSTTAMYIFKLQVCILFCNLLYLAKCYITIYI